jgi:hypothetical protein
VRVERPAGRPRFRPSRLKSICLNQATRFTIQDLGELDFMDAIYIDDVFEMYDMIFSLSIDRNVALLNVTAQSFDNVTFLIDENGGMIPASEYFVRTPITERFAKTNHAASPAGAVG